MSSGETISETGEDRSGFWLPRPWTLIAGYIAVNAYFLLLDRTGWHPGFSLIGDFNVAFRPLSWVWPMASVLLFATAIVVNDRRYVMVPLVAIGLAVNVVVGGGSFDNAVTSSMWWAFSMPHVVMPAVAGLAFARWSRGPSGATEVGRDPSERQALRLPGSDVAVVTAVAVTCIGLIPVFFDLVFLGEHPLVHLPFSAVDALLYPSMFVAAFVIARPLALWLAPALAAIPAVIYTADAAIDSTSCTGSDGESVNCAAQMFWGAVHWTIPPALIVVAFGLIASRWSRWGQVLPDRDPAPTAQARPASETL